LSEYVFTFPVILQVSNAVNFIGFADAKISS